MGSLCGRGSFEGRVQRCKKRKFHPWGLAWRSSTMRGGGLSLVQRWGKNSTDRKFILGCFKYSLTEVANAEHVEGPSIK